MKFKHDVKYLTTTVAILLTISSTLSATQISSVENSKTIEAQMAVTTIETLQPAQSVDTADEVNIPKLNLDTPVESNASVEEKSEEQPKLAENSSPNTPSEPMPLIQNKNNRYIPLLDDAIVFANLDDALPAVVNYYTLASEQVIIDFYQLNFGEFLSQERKRGRLTLTFQMDDLLKRVVISEQSNKHQVDVIVEQVSE